MKIEVIRKKFEEKFKHQAANEKMLKDNMLTLQKYAENLEKER